MAKSKTQEPAASAPVPTLTLDDAPVAPAPAPMPDPVSIPIKPMAEAITAAVNSVSAGMYRIKHGQVFVGNGVYHQVGETIQLSAEEAERMMAEGTVEPAKW